MARYPHHEGLKVSFASKSSMIQPLWRHHGNRLVKTNRMVYGFTMLGQIPKLT